MLDGLERADRLAELLPDLRVLDGHVEAGFGAADLFGRERGGRTIEHVGDRAPREPFVAETRGSRNAHGIEHDLGLTTGHVDGREEAAGHALRIAGNREERHSLDPVRAFRARGDEQEARGVSVEHVGLRAAEHVVATVLRRGRGDRARIPAAIRLGVRERRRELARRDARKELLLLLASAGDEERVDPETHGREERSTEERAAGLLEQRNEIDRAEAEAVVFLGNHEREPSELLGHARPGLGVVAELGLHRGPNLLGRRFAREEAACGLAELVLLVGESEVHRW